MSRPDDELYEFAVDVSRASADADLRDAQRGVPLADFECPHGHLPHDAAVACGCFQPRGRTIMSMVEDLLHREEDDAPPEAEQNGGETKPCRVCGKPSPMKGRYAGKCVEHRGATKAKAKKRKTRTARPAAEPPTPEVVKAAIAFAKAVSRVDDAQKELDAARQRVAELTAQ